MSYLSSAILNQAVLKLKDGLEGPAKEHFTILPLSHQKEWTRHMSGAEKIGDQAAPHGKNEDGFAGALKKEKLCY